MRRKGVTVGHLKNLAIERRNSTVGHLKNLAIERRNEYCRPFEKLSDREKEEYDRPLTPRDAPGLYEEARVSYLKECAGAYEKDCVNDYRYNHTRLLQQFDVTPKTLGAREENRIAVTLDGVKEKLMEIGVAEANGQEEVKPLVFVVRVEKDGLLTYANSDATFKITWPMVDYVDPSNGSSNVPIHSSIIARFNVRVNVSTITSSTFFLWDSNNHEVPATISSDGICATLKPKCNLSYNSKYTATISSGVTDDTGEPLPDSKTWSFTTEKSCPNPTYTQTTTSPTQTTTSPTQTTTSPTQTTTSPTQTTTSPTQTTTSPTQTTTSPTQTTTSPTQTTTSPTQTTTSPTQTTTSPTQTTTSPTQTTTSPTQTTTSPTLAGNFDSEDDRIKLGAGIIFFDDCSSLKRCIESVYDGVDIIFAIDGKFPAFPSESQLSTDGSRELIKSYSKCLLVDYPKAEFEKREKYLEYSAHYSVDVLMIVDSDEFVLKGNDWNKFRGKLKKVIFEENLGACNVYAIMLQSLDDRHEFTPYPGNMVQSGTDGILCWSTRLFSKQRDQEDWFV